MPYFMRLLAKKAGQRFEQTFGANPFQTSQSQQEGEISVDKMPPSQSKSKSTVGEYVDYEEID